MNCQIYDVSMLRYVRHDRVVENTYIKFQSLGRWTQRRGTQNLYGVVQQNEQLISFHSPPDQPDPVTLVRPASLSPAGQVHNERP